MEEMSPEFNLLDCFFGGIVANIPLWIYSLFFTVVGPLSLLTVVTLTALGIVGGVIAGYLIKIKTNDLNKWAPLVTGSLAFFASILILGSIAPQLTDMVLFPAFIMGTYFGIFIYKRYPFKTKPQVAPLERTGNETEDGKEAEIIKMIKF